MQVPTAWHWSWATQVTGLPVQAPAWQLSACVQALLSLQVVPLAAFGFEQVPSAGLHVPATWQASCAVQVTVLPLQVPLWQASAVVQAFPSLQVVPSALATAAGQPVAGTQAPTVWQVSAPVQVTAVPPVHAPTWQVSPV